MEWSHGLPLAFYSIASLQRPLAAVVPRNFRPKWVGSTTNGLSAPLSPKLQSGPRTIGWLTPCSFCFFLLFVCFVFFYLDTARSGDQRVHALAHACLTLIIYGGGGGGACLCRLPMPLAALMSSAERRGVKEGGCSPAGCLTPPASSCPAIKKSLFFIFACLFLCSPALTAPFLSVKEEAQCEPTTWLQSSATFSPYLRLSYKCIFITLFFVNQYLCRQELNYAVAYLSKCGSISLGNFPLSD